MLRIGIIGGQLGEKVYDEPYQKWMDSVSNRSYNKKTGEYTFEAALAASLSQKKNVEATYYTKLQECDLQLNDVNFFAGTNLINAWETSPKEYKRWIQLIKDKKNHIYPPLKEQEFLYDKGRYLMYFKNKGIPIAPTFVVRENRDIPSILQKVKRNKWESFVLKPHHAYANVSINRFDMNDTKLQDKLTKYFKKNKHFPGFVCQETMMGFKEHYEVKSFWINGEYKYYIATKAQFDGSVFSQEELSDEDGNIFVDDTVSKKVLDQIKKMGRKIVKEFPAQPIHGKKTPPLYLRLDFGCCLGNTLDTSKYFLNEVEYAGCRLFLDVKDVFHHWTKGYYEKAKEISNSDHS